MLISHKLKFLTIDIPKTGTRSYRETLESLRVLDIIGQPGAAIDAFYQHTKATKLLTEFNCRGWDWDSYYKYVTIRNPWARYGSYLQWAKNTYKYCSNQPYENLTSTQQNIYKIFNKLFTRLNFDDQKILSILISSEDSQEKYFTNNREIIVDHIARFEHIKQEFGVLCKKVGLNNLELKHSNNGGDYNYKDFYNQELIDTVAKKEEYIINNYGYQY